MLLNDERSRIEQWMLAIISDGGVDRFDDLHIDQLNPRWGDKNRWIEGGVEAFRTALSVRNQHRLPFTVCLAFSLVATDQPCGIDFQTREDLLAKLDWSPPSLYLFDRGKEPGKQIAPTEGAVQVLDPAICGAQADDRCYYLEFKPEDDDEFRRSVWVEG
jgi:hypothetical protein